MLDMIMFSGSHTCFENQDVLPLLLTMVSSWSTEEHEDINTLKDVSLGIQEEMGNPRLHVSLVNGLLAINARV
ncbi:hypothetical protein HI914_03063 [Erysiphe necator]|nr:hypothetical protein HI914_03063 [Erysiphe necator]